MSRRDFAVTMQDDEPGTSSTFWDARWAEFEPGGIDPETVRATASPLLRSFLDVLPDPAGADVLDLGCGNGLLAVYLAQLGANVVAVDTSAQAVANTLALAKRNGVEERVQAHRLDAFELPTLNRSFDHVVGTFVLHHLEPFEEFAAVLGRILKSGGTAFFYENSSRNRILMLFRRLVPGRFGTPRHSDAEEYPLEPSEIDVLRRTFARVEVRYPAFVVFHYAGEYLFRSRPSAVRVLDRLDRLVWDRVPAARKYSYHQIVTLEKG